MVEYKITSDFDEWDKVSEKTAEYLVSRGCEQARVISFMVAAEEIFANISAYAYKGKTGNVIISAKLTDDKLLTMDFYDFGVPFNPLSVKKPDTCSSARQRKIGGLGIFIARAKADDVLYEYSDNSNHLTLIKKF